MGAPKITLDQLEKLANEAHQLHQDILEHEEELEVLKESLRVIEEEKLPKAMIEVGMEDFTTLTGLRLVLNTYVHANIPKDKMAEGLKWLRDNGHEDLVRNVVQAEFTRGQDDLASSAVRKLAGLGITAEQKSTVHWASLTSMVREGLKKGVEYPHDILGIKINDVVTLGQKKRKS